MSESKFEQWCILEIMGHQKFAGYVTEQVIAGQAFIRIDIPERETDQGRQPGFTRLFGPSSVYGITPTTEMIARQVAARLGHRPIDLYDFPEEFRSRLKAAMARPAIEAVDPTKSHYDEDSEALEDF